MNLESAISSEPGAVRGRFRGGSRVEKGEADVTRNDGARPAEKNESGGKARVVGR